MSKPDDIPQDAWAAGSAAAEALYNHAFKFDAHSDGCYLDREVSQSIVARAILAERERCAAAAGKYLMLKTPLDVTRIVECEEAIRKGGE